MSPRRQIRNINRYELQELRVGSPTAGLHIVHWNEPELTVLGPTHRQYEINVDGNARDVHGGDRTTTPYRRVELHADGQAVAEYVFCVKDQKVMIHLDSQCLGDTLAWMPVVEAFCRRYRPAELVVSTFYSDLFDYTDFTVIDAEGHRVKDVYAYLEVGYDKQSSVDRGKPIQQVAADRLGVPAHTSGLPRLRLPTLARRGPGRYVCIAPESPKPIALWHYPNGWQQIVDHLVECGYEVLNISAENNLHLERCVNRTGQLPLSDRIHDLHFAEFFVGLSSGLAWLAWGLGKEVVMISGFTHPFNEFPCRRVINTDVCHGCWNETCEDSPCPRFLGQERQWECSRAISPDRVKSEIDDLAATSAPS